MKKISAVILILFYGIASWGATINLHFCCGRVDKISFSSQQSTLCKFKASFKGKGCCDNKQFEIKIKSDQETVAKQLITDNDFVIIPSAVFLNHTISLRNTFITLFNTGPPLPPGIPIFLKNCVFRI